MAQLNYALPSVRSTSYHLLRRANSYTFRLVAPPGGAEKGALMFPTFRLTLGSKAFAVMTRNKTGNVGRTYKSEALHQTLLINVLKPEEVPVSCDILFLPSLTSVNCSSAIRRDLPFRRT